MWSHLAWNYLLLALLPMRYVYLYLDGTKRWSYLAGATRCSNLTGTLLLARLLYPKWCSYLAENHCLLVLPGSPCVART